MRSIDETRRLNKRRASVPGERWATALGGLALAAWSLQRRSPWAFGAGVTAGAALLWRSLRGHDGPWMQGQGAAAADR